jgi:virulence factor
MLYIKNGVNCRFLNFLALFDFDQFAYFGSMKNSNKKRIAIVGLGKIAQKVYLPLVTGHSMVSPILCTRNRQVLNSLASQYRVEETSTSIEDLIRIKPDAVMVHTATEGHFSMVLQLLQANIPVFVDKPLCYSLNECEELLNLSTQKQCLLYLGFNRRFAPLIQLLAKHPNPSQIFWQKNRVNLPGNPRVFVFDDFIHVIDSFRYLTNGPIVNLKVIPKFKNDLLSSLQVLWQQNDTVLNGFMHRESGLTEERIEYFTMGNKWVINELNTGIHFKNEQQFPILFDNWDTTSHKRGFDALFEDWIQALDKTFDTKRNQDIWETHNLCETIVSSIEKQQKI